MNSEVKYKGLTKKQYKRQYGSSTAGKDKTECCRATGLDKGIIKYPRSYKTEPVLFASIYDKKDKASGRTGGYKTKN